MISIDFSHKQARPAALIPANAIVLRSVKINVMNVSQIMVKVHCMVLWI